MDLLTYYLLAGGFGLIQSMSAMSKNGLVNKLATYISYAGIFVIGIAGWRNFGLGTMLSGILTVFLVGMVLTFILMKLTGRKKEY